MGKREGSRKLRPDGMDDFGFLYCEKEYPWEAKNGVLRLQYMCVPLDISPFKFTKLNPTDSTRLAIHTRYTDELHMNHSLRSNLRLKGCSRFLQIENIQSAI